MSQNLPPLRLTGAQILRDGAMQPCSIAFAEGRIVEAPLAAIDLSGYLILPGIIDLHGDGFERHMAPRPSAPFPLPTGLASFDREAASHGVTTAYMAQGWSWEGGHRGPDYAETMLTALQAYRPQAMTDLRVQIRAETHLVAQTARLIDVVKQHQIDFVVFNDHLAEAQHMAWHDPTDFAAWARKIGKSTAEMTAAIDLAAAQAKQVPRSLCSLAEAFDALGVVYGSHDDLDGATRDFYAMIGAKVAEFPLTRRAALAAHVMLSPVLMGAPNVVRGRSQAGNASATALVAEGLCDVLVSDYHIPALPLAVWTLVEKGVLDLPAAWAMISSRPAEVMRMADRGRLEPGLRADMVVINATTRAIEATISAGRLSYLAGEAARRFMGARQVQQLAAE